MNTIFFPIYGLARMILGVAQLVGLTAGFFIVEWVIHYPRGEVSFVFDEDIVAVVYLAIFLRAVFHLVAGIGLARMSEWVKSWLIYGWPIVLIVVGGLLYTIMSHWVELGRAQSVLEFIVWPKLIVYLMFVAFDYFFILRQLDALIQSPTFSGKDIPDVKMIGAVLFGLVLFFVVLIYLGKPIKQGFHQGYYRIKDVDNTLVETRELVQEKIEKKASLDKKPLLNVNTAPKETKEEKEAIDKELEDEKPPVPNPNIPEDLPYRTVFGYLGGLAIIAGFVAQLLCIYRQRELFQFIYSFLMLSAGFFLLLVYGMSNKLMPVSFLAFFALSSTVSIAVLLWFSRNQE